MARHGAATVRRPPRTGRGSMALELSILAPVLILLLLLILAFGRYIHAANVVEATAQDAARGASQSRDGAGVDAAIESAVSNTKQNEKSLPSSCRDTLAGSPKSELKAGGTVAIQITCTVEFKDLNFLALNVGRQTISKTYLSTVDQYRGLATK